MAPILLALLAALTGLVAVRLIQRLLARHRPPNRRTAPARTLIVLGSGGHTAEMLRLTRRLDRTRYTPRVYVVATTDRISVAKVLDEEGAADDYRIVRIPRSREVRQRYASAALSTWQALCVCAPLVWRERPDVVLSNGPGTCVPVVAVAALWRLIGVNRGVRLVFVESFCRVKSISLSGQMLQCVVDLFVVQWPELRAKAWGAKYLGKLM